MLKAIYKDVGEIPEELKDYYKEDNGVYILKVEGQDGYQLENVQGLKSALQNERNEAKTLKQTLAQYGDIKPDDIPTLKQKSSLADSSSDEINSIKSNYTKKLNDLQSQLQSKDKVMNDYLINAEINRVLSSVPLIDNGAALLRPHITGNIKVIEGKVCPVDNSGNPMISNQPNNLGNMSIDEYVESMKTNKVYNSLFKGDNIQGMGSKTSIDKKSTVDAGSNPFITKNLTEMSRMIKNNPEQASRMEAEAKAHRENN
jgi:hypothetical protein